MRESTHIRAQHKVGGRRANARLSVPAPEQMNECGRTRDWRGKRAAPLLCTPPLFSSRAFPPPRDTDDSWPREAYTDRQGRSGISRILFLIERSRARSASRRSVKVPPSSTFRRAVRSSIRVRAKEFRTECKVQRRLVVHYVAR